MCFNSPCHSAWSNVLDPPNASSVGLVCACARVAVSLGPSASPCSGLKPPTSPPSFFRGLFRKNSTASQGCAAPDADAQIPHAELLLANRELQAKLLALQEEHASLQQEAEWLRRRNVELSSQPVDRGGHDRQRKRNSIA